MHEVSSQLPDEKNWRLIAGGHFPNIYLVTELESSFCGCSKLTLYPQYKSDLIVSVLELILKEFV